MVGIVNHEHEVVSYRVEVKIDGVNSNGGAVVLVTTYCPDLSLFLPRLIMGIE